MARPDRGLKVPHALAAELGLRGALERLSGGDVSEVWRCGDRVLKTHPTPPPGLFATEARGLRRLAERGCRVPRVWVEDERGLVLEYLPPGPADWRDLAEQLARLHTAPAAGYGSDHPVFIGPLELPATSGPMRAVWRSHLATLAARPALASLRGGIEAMLDRAEPPLEGPVLIHGDLWSGNVHMSTAGAALIDPSAWCGERAVDLAMMELFGGFPARFWDAYGALAPVSDEIRRWLPYWRVYPLAVHGVLFGGSYRSALRSALRAVPD